MKWFKCCAISATDRSFPPVVTLWCATRTVLTLRTQCIFFRKRYPCQLWACKRQALHFGTSLPGTSAFIDYFRYFHWLIYNLTSALHTIKGAIFYWNTVKDLNSTNMLQCIICTMWHYFHFRRSKAGRGLFKRIVRDLLQNLANLAFAKFCSVLTSLAFCCDCKLDWFSAVAQPARGEKPKTGYPPPPPA